MSVTKEDITTALTTVAFPSINPFSRLKKLYQEHVDHAQFKYQFETRNKTEAVKPFLDSLEVPYLLITPELIIVDIDPMTDDKLQRLGFVSTSSVMPQQARYKKALRLTQHLFTDRVYQKEYNIELYLAEPQDWDKIQLAKSIVDDLGAKADVYFRTFITVYNRLKH